MIILNARVAHRLVFPVFNVIFSLKWGLTSNPKPFCRMSGHVSRAIALEFANQILGRKDTELRFETEPLKLLQDLTRAVLNTVPFHNVFHLATPISEREAPSLDQCIQDFLSHRGGLCWTLNTGMYLLLNALGYDVISALASVYDKNNNNHAVTIVRNLTTVGDVYLVDVGFGYPTLHVVPLDFDRESDVFFESFVRYRIVRLQNGWLYREYLAPDLKTREHYGYYFRNETWELNAIRNSINTTIYKSTHFFNSSLRIFSFVQDKCIAIKDRVLLVEGDDHKLHPRDLASDKEVIEIVSKHFPKIPTHLLEAALKNLATLK